MDINKYLGKFLFKNKYCSLPGFGTLNLNVIGAKNNLATIEPGNFNIQYSPVGSIDDKFANFIATNENISLNKASNLISSYCNEIKEALNVGSSFEVTGLGTFVNDASGKVVFNQDNDININNFLFTNSTDANSPENNFQTRPLEVVEEKAQIKKANSINLSKIFIPILVLAVLSAAGYFAYKYIQNSETNKTEEAENAANANTDSLAFNNVQADTNSALNNSVDTINSNRADSSSSNTVAATPVATDMKVAILTYATQADADEKCKTLLSYGNNTSVVKGDSSKYYVAIGVNSNGRPVEAVVDSLRKFFNPSEKKGKVFLLK